MKIKSKYKLGMGKPKLHSLVAAQSSGQPNRFSASFKGYFAVMLNSIQHLSVKLNGFRGKPGMTNPWRKAIAIALIVAMGLSLVIFWPHKKTPTAQAAWYGAGGTWWGYRQKITLNPTHDKVLNTSQADFPVLIKITDADNPVFAKAQSSGNDILFTSSDATTKISHEIEKFDVVTHELDAWVKISTLATAADTIIYMYYGNAGATDQQDLANTWNTDFKGVWHMNEASGTIYDATTNDNDGAVDAGSPTYGATGKVGKAVNLDGSSWFAKATPDNLPYGSTARTYEAWVAYSDTTVTYRAVLSYGTQANSQLVDFLLNSSNPRKPFQGFYNDNHTSLRTIPADSTLHHLAVTVSGTSLTFYIDGVPEAAQNLVGPLNTVEALPLHIGRIDSPAYSYNGTLDELRISSSARSADWIATEYNNQNDPATFFSLEAEATGDIIAPSNPSSFTGKDIVGGSTTLTSGNYYNYPTPYFEWPAAEAVGGAHDTGNSEASGVAGYYLYFGTTCGAGGADPATTRGVMTDTGGGVHYQTGVNVSVPDLATNEGSYCLRVKSKDNAGNISSVYEAFLYKYEITAPNDPAFITASPSGYTGTNSFSFSWPVATDGSSTPQSGVAGYQYKRGNGEGWSSTIVGASVSAIEAYQQGTNTFFVRSVDAAGNTSAGAVQTSYYYTTGAPVKPGNLSVDPATESATNDFSFSWDAPAHDHAIVNYGYSINASPSDQNITWTGSADTSLAAGPYATQQDTNDFYLVAKDEAGNYAFDGANVATISFSCSSPSPPIPVMFAISDSSDRSSNKFSLTVKWSAGIGQGSSFDHYSVERSTNGTSFTETTTTTSTIYLDPDLTESQIYYYRVKAVDNAGKISAYSAILSRAPTGRFTTPPTYVSGPEAGSIKATQATITWVTDRSSTSQVRYGTKSDQLDKVKGQIDAVTSHTVILSGLSASTKYYLQAQSLDEERDYAEDIACSGTVEFTTLALPVISNVTVSNITLNSADVSWETSMATASQIKYGTSLDYGTTADVDAGSYVSKHTITLSDLAHSTTYHLKINGNDSDDNSFGSDDYVFDTQKMPKISSVSSQEDNTGPEPVTKIEWKTNVPTTSSIEYFAEDNSTRVEEESRSDLVEDHLLELRGLKDNTVYRFVVSGRDQFGNLTESDRTVLKTKMDTRPPKITNIIFETSNVGMGSQSESKVIVSWKTDEPSTSEVEFAEGITGDTYTSNTEEDQTQTNSHLVIVSGLKDKVPYHLRVCSADKVGNLACSSDNTFVSGEVKRSTMEIVLDALRKAFGWTSKLVK